MTEKEMIAKAKNAGSAEEIKAMAANEGWQMTDEEAASYFEELKELTGEKKTGELSDDELDNVSGGGCLRDVPGEYESCSNYKCTCGNELKKGGFIRTRADDGCIKWCCPQCHQVDVYKRQKLRRASRATYIIAPSSVVINDTDDEEEQRRPSGGYASNIRGFRG